MPIEKDVIVDKLKDEGINENLSNGLNFETEDELVGWIDNYKSGLPQVKDLKDYTKEELEEIAKDPQFKGAKGLQGLLDSVRQKAKVKVTTTDQEKKVTDELVLPDDIKDRLNEIETLKARIEKDDFEKNVLKLCNDAQLDAKSAKMVLKQLPANATEEAIKAEIQEVKDYLTELGIKNFGTPGGGKNTGGINKQVMKDWVAKEKAKKEKFNKKQ